MKKSDRGPLPPHPPRKKRPAPLRNIFAEDPMARGSRALGERPTIADRVRSLIKEVNDKLPATLPGDVTSAPAYIDPGIKQPWMESAPMKRCKACNQYKEYVGGFTRSAAFPDGYESVCIACRPAGETVPPPPSTATSSDSPAKPGRPARGRERFKVRRLLIAAAARAARQRMPFDLYNFELELELKLKAGTCEYSGEPFDFYVPLSARAPSLYLIDPAKGFIYTNVRVICWAMNCALGTWGADVLRIIVNGWMKKGS